jgi:DNA polymerase-3 subunit delta'
MILGHEKQLDLLKKLVNSNKLPHAILFVGPSRVGKKRVALELAEWILGKDYKKNPDFYLLESSEKISIETIREISWKSSLKPAVSQFIFCILDNAHLMTREAQQSFLKTLEEPRANTIFILITPYSELLLPTIRSRCEIFKFSYVPKDKMQEFLRKNTNFSKEEQEKILEIADGRAGILMEIVQNPKKLEEFTKMEKLLKGLPKLSLFQKFEISKKMSKENGLIDNLENWLSFYRRAFLYYLNNQKNLQTLSYLNRILRELQKTIFYCLTTNINPRSILDLLMLEF